jgi:aminoglycoside phosphotransferase (APT) family kinase protein
MASQKHRAGDPADLEPLARDLTSVFPDLSPIAPLRVIGRGFRSLAVETAGGVVLRIGRRPEALIGYEREFRLLPLIADRLPLAVPRPQYRAAPDERFPFGIIGYQTLPGESLHPPMLARADIGAIARAIGRFLHALHNVPIEMALSAGAQDATEWMDNLTRQRDVILSCARALFTTAEYATIKQWWDAFLTERAKIRYAPALCHTDLWYEHVLIDASSSAITGILDFESARIADPALDLATQLHLGEPFAALVLAAYFAAGAQQDVSFVYRVRRLWEHREFDGLADALRKDDEDEIADAVGKIRRGPVLTPDGASLF